MAPPSDVEFGERAHGRAVEAALTVRIYVLPDLVAREPVDLVLLDSVVDDLVTKGHAVGGAIDRALPADLAEVFHAVVDGLVGHQRQVRHDRVGHVDTRAEFPMDEEPVASERTDS